LLLFAVASSAAESRTEELVKSGKYLTAVKALKDDPEFATSKGFSRYVHLLLTYKASTSNFMAFAMRDPAAGESPKSPAEASGDAVIVETDLEARIFERLSEATEDPELNFAAGEYLSRLQECGCGEARHFTGGQASGEQYFQKAYDAGLFDGWSLFRLGLGRHMDGDFPAAVEFYEKSLVATPGYLPASYNMAVALFLSGDVDGALKTVGQVLDKYPDDSRNADAHHLLARIDEAKGNLPEAKVQYQKALELWPRHENAGPDYIAFLRRTGASEEYVAFVERFLGQDMARPNAFNNYLDFLMNAGATDSDRRVYADLALFSPEDNAKAGTFNYGMGRLALLLKEKEKAAAHYKKSLAAFTAMPSPPEGAIEALKSLLIEAGGDPAAPAK